MEKNWRRIPFCAFIGELILSHVCGSLKIEISRAPKINIFESYRVYFDALEPKVSNEELSFYTYNDHLIDDKI